MKKDMIIFNRVMKGMIRYLMILCLENGFLVLKIIRIVIYMDRI